MKASELISLFLSEADIQHRSRSMYDFSIKKFFIWAHSQGKDPESLRRSDIINYKDHLVKSGILETTVKNYFTIVRLFFRWASDNRYLENITDGIRHPKYKKGYKKLPLNIDQAKSLLSSIDRSDEKGLRDYAIIMLLLENGLRRSEVLSIDLKDMTQKNGKDVIFIKGKGRTYKDQFIIPSEETVQAINDYLVLRNCYDDTDPLFTSIAGTKRGQRLAAMSLSVIMKKRLKEIGLEGKYYTCHSLRHTAACLLLDNGNDLHEVQLFLRHNSPNTTQLYTRIIDEQIKFENKAGKTLHNLLFNDQKENIRALNNNNLI